MENLLTIMKQLRGPSGCPWDKEQTHKSLQKHLIEEAYEVVDAIERGNDDALKEELGDLLLQIAFHATIAEEEKRFDYKQVEQGICDKLISRHTHIFGKDTALDAAQVTALWNENKKKEKGHRTVSAQMDAMPSSFPALLASVKVQSKAADVGFDWDDAKGALSKLEEEASELQEAMERGAQGEMEEELGDLLFSVVNVARLLKVDPEVALHKTVGKFKRRFAAMETLCLERGESLDDMTLAQWDLLWDHVKKKEGGVE